MTIIRLLIFDKQIREYYLMVIDKAKNYLKQYIIFSSIRNKKVPFETEGDF